MVFFLPATFQLTTPDRRGRLWLGCFVTLWMTSTFLTSSAEGQVTLSRIFPPVVSIGETSTVTAEGKFAAWPPTILCDRDDVHITAGEDSGELNVRVAKATDPEAADPEAAAPGVAWVRMTDSQSASDWVPVLVTSAKVVEEAEPNNRIAETQTVAMPAVIAGRLAKGGDSDAYRLNVQAGQTLVASLTAHRVLGSPMDAVLQLSDLDGNVLSQSDDVRGLDPQIVFTFDTDIQCVVRVFAFPETPNSTIGFAGSDDFVYAMDLTTGPFLDHVAVGRSSVLPFGYNLDSSDADDFAKSVRVSDPTRVSPSVASLPGASGWDWV